MDEQDIIKFKEMACADGDFGLEVRHLDISGHDVMDEQDISLRKWLVLMGILA
jgi:hypothetical protein